MITVMLLSNARNLNVRSIEVEVDVKETLEQSRSAADQLDRANTLAELERLSGVSAVRSKLAGKGQDWCEDCGEDIPLERRAAAPWAVRCAPCQEIKELRAKHGV